jgi:hypothetical protein
MSYMDFSSWPRDQEQSFVVYEQRQAESQRKALVLGAIVGAIALVFGVGIYAGVTPKAVEMKGANMSNLSHCAAGTHLADKACVPDEPKAAPAPAPQAPAPAPAPAPSSDKPAAPDKK